MKARNLAYTAAAALVTVIAGAAPILASTTTAATFTGQVRITNTSYASANNAVPFTLTTSNLIGLGYVNADLTNTAMTTGTGVDVPFMPAAGTSSDWLVWVDDIAQNKTLNYLLYMGGPDDMEGKIRWFPGTGGMTVADAASLELGNNFVIEIGAYFDVNGGGYMSYKGGAITCHNDASGQITTIIRDEPAETATQTTSNTGTNVLYGNNWAAQTFTATHSGIVSGVSLNFSKFGSPNYNVDILLYNASADLPTTLIGSLCTFPAATATGSLVDYYIASSAGLEVVSGTVYALVVKSVGGDGSNNIRFSSNSAGGYAGGRFASSTNGGGSWSGSTHDRDFTVFVIPTVKSVATGLTSGEHVLKVTADGTNLKTYWDDVEKDSDALGAVSVANNANGWIFTQSYTNPYVEYVKVTVGGSLVGHWMWENSETIFTDLSGEGNDASPTFRTTTTDPDLSAALVSFAPVAPISGGSSPTTTAVVPISSVPADPAVTDVSPANLVNVPYIGQRLSDFLKERNIPEGLITYPGMMFALVAAVFVTYGISKDLGWTGAALFCVAGLFIAWRLLPWVALFPFGVVLVFCIIKRRTPTT